MLSGEGMQRRKTVKNNNRSNQQKSNFASAAHFFCTFLCRCFARLQLETSRNFLVTRFFRSLFFHCRSFSPCIGGRQHFSFCHRRYKIFMLFFQQKNVSFAFYLSLQIFVALFLVEFVGLSLFLFFSVFILLESVTINLSLILQKNTDTETISAFQFRLFDPLAASPFQDAGNYAISRQNNLELQLGCHTC